MEAIGNIKRVYGCRDTNKSTFASKSLLNFFLDYLWEIALQRSGLKGSGSGHHQFRHWMTTGPWTSWAAFVGPLSHDRKRGKFQRFAGVVSNNAKNVIT